MLDSILKAAVSFFVAIFLSAIGSNADRLFKYYKRRVNWFRPEFDIKHDEKFYIITSSRNKAAPKDVSPRSEYRKSDEYVIGDMYPLLVALRGRKLSVQPYLPEGFPDDHHDENIMTFGGEVANGITKFLLRNLDSPLRFNKYRIKDKRENITYLPKLDVQGRIRIDYALVAKAPNPGDENNIVYIFAGIHKPGTLGAAYFTQEKYARMINERVKGLKAFVALIEMQVDYLTPERTEPIVTPKSIIRIYDLSLRQAK